MAAYIKPPNKLLSIAGSYGGVEAAASVSDVGKPAHRGELGIYECRIRRVTFLAKKTLRRLIELVTNVPLVYGALRWNQHARQLIVVAAVWVRCRNPRSFPGAALAKAERWAHQGRAVLAIDMCEFSAR